MTPPQDIPAARGVNILIGLCLLILGAFVLLPIFGTLRYDGFGDVLDWPTLFYAFLAIGITLAFLGCRLLIKPQRVGAEVLFHKCGFTVNVRRFLQRDISHRLSWSEIEEIKQVEVPRGGDYLSFRLSHDAAVQHGLIQPTTRHNASRKLVKREIPFPPKLSAVSSKEAVARFQASAAQAGAKLVEAQSLNLVVFERRVWTVQHALSTTPN